MIISFISFLFSCLDLLFSCLVLSLLIHLLLSCLVSLSLSVSLCPCLSLSPCVVVVVVVVSCVCMSLWSWCVRAVWCGTLKTSVCTGTTLASGAGTHGDVLNVHTENVLNVDTERGVGVWGVSVTHQYQHQHTPTPAHCTPTTHTTHNTQHRTRKVSSPVPLTQICHVGLSRASEVYHFTALTFRALLRDNNVPDSSDHSLHLKKLFNSSSPEGHRGRNQPPGGSICLSPPNPKYNERFARPSTMVS